MHMKELFKEVDCLDKLRTISEAVKARKTKGTQTFLEIISELHCQEALSNVLNPLDPSFRCKRVK